MYYDSMYQPKNVSLKMMYEPIEVQLLRLNRYNLLRFNSQTVGFIGASLSEPHTSESNSAPVSICIYIYIYIYIYMWWTVVRTYTESVYKILFLRIMHYVTPLRKHR